MPNIFLNQPLNLCKQGVVWAKTAGITKLNLHIVSALPEIDPDQFYGQDNSASECYQIKCQFSWLAKGNHRFIFLNPIKSLVPDERVYGIFTDSEYGYELLEGEAIQEAESVGGGDNAKHKFGIYKAGTLLQLHTYKNLRAGRLFRLTHQGWMEEAIMPYLEEKADMKTIAHRYKEVI